MSRYRSSPDHSHEGDELNLVAHLSRARGHCRYRHDPVQPVYATVRRQPADPRGRDGARAGRPRVAWLRSWNRDRPCGRAPQLGAGAAVGTTLAAGGLAVGGAHGDAQRCWCRSGRRSRRGCNRLRSYRRERCSCRLNGCINIQRISRRKRARMGATQRMRRNQAMSHDDSAAARARIAASMIGTKKQSDLPEPVPVVTTKLCRRVAFAIAWA